MALLQLGRRESILEKSYSITQCTTCLDYVLIISSKITNILKNFY